MNVFTPTPYETTTNDELLEKVWNNQPTSRLHFLERAKLSSLPLRSAVNLTDCYFADGLAFCDSRLIQDVSLDGSRLVGDCYFERLFIPKILSLMHLDASKATLHLNHINVVGVETADLWISCKEGTTPPKLVTDNDVIRKMFAQLANDPTAMVSYNETA